MLVLSRKVAEALVIGTDVRITVLKVDRNHVRIGIEAPGDVTILRAELVDAGREQGGWKLPGLAGRDVPAVAAP